MKRARTQKQKIRHLEDRTIETREILLKDRDAYWIDERQLAAIAKAEADKGQE